MKKNSTHYVWLLATFLLMSACEQNDEGQNASSSSALMTVDFTVSGISNFTDGNSAKTRSAAFPITVTAPFNEDYELEATLVPTEQRAESRAATVLEKDVRYRVIAYQGGVYKGYADYQFDGSASLLTGGGLKLEAGVYTFCAYSHNQTTAIAEDAATTTQLPVDATTDFLYWKSGEVTISGSTTLGITFKHLFSQFIVKYDAASFYWMDIMAEESDLKKNAQNDELSKIGVWTINADGVEEKPGSETYIPSLEFPALWATVLTSNPVNLLPTTTALTFWTHVKCSDFSFFGSIALSNLKLESNTSYTCIVKLKAMERIIEMDDKEYKGRYGGGNCWMIVTENQYISTYSFPALEGRSSDMVGTVVGGGTPDGAKVVWENAYDYYENNNLIDSIYYNAKENRMFFRVKGKKRGNAVIAVTAGDKILWSWHIWMGDKGLREEVPKGTWMPWNLGANTDANSYYSTSGLRYQWGRKDPFSSVVSKEGGVKDVAYSARFPDVFITGSSSTSIWCSPTTNFWGDETLRPKYDPCPKGWTVMQKSDYENFTYESSYYDDYRGRIWNNLVFPLGSIFDYNGTLTGDDTQYWSATSSDGSTIESLLLKSKVTHQSAVGSVNGCLVRCIKE